MKRLLCFSALVLVGCPNWDELTRVQCQTLRSNSGVCEGLFDAGSTGGGGEQMDAGLGGGGGATGGGGGTTGGGGGTTGGGGGMTGGGGGGPDAGPPDGGIDAGPPDRQINWSSGSSTGFLFLEDVGSLPFTRLSTGNDIGRPRRPVLVGETPTGDLTFTLEDEGDAGFELWLSSSQAQRGNADHVMSTSAANDRTWAVGTNYMSWISVDSLISVSLNNDWPFQAVTALAQVVLPDAGPGFIGARGSSNGVSLFTVDCDGCNSVSNTVGSGISTVDSATSDALEVGWFSARVGAQAAARDVWVFRGNVGLGITGSFPVPGATTNGRTLIASSSASTQGGPHLAWVDGDVLHVAALGPAAVLHDDLFDFSEPVVLAALADNGSTTIAVVSVAGRHVAVIHRHAEPPEFFVVDSANGFVPSAAHVRDQLRLAGQCVVDGGFGNCSGASNWVLVYDGRPDGGAW